MVRVYCSTEIVRYYLRTFSQLFGPASHQGNPATILAADLLRPPRKTTTRASDVSVVAGTIAIEATLPTALLPTVLARLEQPASRMCFGRLAPR